MNLPSTEMSLTRSHRLSVPQIMRPSSVTDEQKWKLKRVNFTHVTFLTSWLIKWNKVEVNLMHVTIFHIILEKRGLWKCEPRLCKKTMGFVEAYFKAEISKLCFLAQTSININNAYKYSIKKTWKNTQSSKCPALNLGTEHAETELFLIM